MGKEKDIIRGIFLPKFAQEALHVTPYDDVVVVIEDGEVKLKNQIAYAFKEINEVIKDDFAKVGVVDEETANEYFMKFRYGDE